MEGFSEGKGGGGEGGIGFVFRVIDIFGYEGHGDNEVCTQDAGISNPSESDCGERCRNRLMLAVELWERFAEVQSVLEFAHAFRAKRIPKSAGGEEIECVAYTFQKAANAISAGSGLNVATVGVCFSLTHPTMFMPNVHCSSNPPHHVSAPSHSSM